MNIRIQRFFFFIILLEGYAVLSTELLAIRQLLPFVGSGTDSISIIIAAVLLPLSLGYYVGGIYSPLKKGYEHYRSVRKKLIQNLFVATLFLCVGLSYYFVSSFFDLLISKIGLLDRLLLTTTYALLFLIYPIFLLGQTVPLVSHYFRRFPPSILTGKVLFYSTLGSFLGAVFCTIILMNIIGVNQAASVTIAALVLLIVILSRKNFKLYAAISVMALFIAFYINSYSFLERKHIVYSNIYNTAQIQESGLKYKRRNLILNGVISSGVYLNKDESLYEYVKYIEDNFIRSLENSDKRARILVLGAGGFTIGLFDKKHEYVFVDIDPELLKVSEDELLKEPLSENKSFVPLPARAYLTKNKEKFDLVIVDLAKGHTGSPDHLLTVEFYQQIKSQLIDGGIVVMNYHLPALIEDKYSMRLDNTIRQVFPFASRQVIQDFDPWMKENQRLKNVLYIGKNLKVLDAHSYSDLLNRAYLDKKKNILR